MTDHLHDTVSVVFDVAIEMHVLLWSRQVLLERYFIWPTWKDIKKHIVQYVKQKRTHKTNIIFIAFQH